MSEDGSGGSSALADKLALHLEPLEQAARERERERVAAEEVAQARPRRRLREGELMALIFVHLDDDNPRVCEGVDFDRITIIQARDQARDQAKELAEDLFEPDSDRSDIASAGSAGSDDGDPTLDAAALVGAGWTDDLGPLAALDLEEQPELSEAQRELLAGAPRRISSELDLHGLDRHAALRHLALFVGACRSRRHRWCRVITGKGLSSADAPVLKREVLRWCLSAELGRAQVVAWAPELDRHDEWGAVILRLRARPVG